MTVETPAASLQCLDDSHRGVRVDFFKHRDRFSHTVSGIDGGEILPLLSSIEGTAEETAPPSPPFAELHQQDETLYLTGATTLGHWSMSVQANDGRLLFDVACRVKGEVGSLGGTYRMHAANHFVESENAVVTESGREILNVVPASQTANGFPTTIQWRYTIACRGVNKIHDPILQS